MRARVCVRVRAHACPRAAPTTWPPAAGPAVPLDAGGYFVDGGGLQGSAWWQGRHPMPVWRLGHIHSRPSCTTTEACAGRRQGVTSRTHSAWDLLPHTPRRQRVCLPALPASHSPPILRTSNALFEAQRAASMAYVKQAQPPTTQGAQTRSPPQPIHPARTSARPPTHNRTNRRSPAPWSRWALGSRSSSLSRAVTRRHSPRN